MSWLKVSKVAILGTSFTKVREGRFWGPYGSSWSGPRWRCDVCGREGYGDDCGPSIWAESCRRGHAPCDFCGQMQTLKIDGQPRIHTRCPERRAD